MIKNEILVQSPTRIDFAGGTLDCWPINALLNPVSTINAAISIYTTCRLSPRDDEAIHIHSKDMNVSFEFADLQELLDSDDSKVRFYREHISHWMPEQGFNLSTHSDSPVGGGLGGSSSLSISIFKAFSQMHQTELDEYEIVRICSNIEAKILKTPTGTQDYFPPLQGGFNVIDYGFAGPVVKRLSVRDLGINDNISVFFTGKSHHSGINNWQVLQKFIEGDAPTVNALEEIKRVAVEMRAAVIASDWNALPNLFREEYEARMDLAESFSSPEIEQLADIALKNGGDAIKICGAGGGGCVFIWSSPEKRSQVISACVDAGFRHLDVELV